MSQALKFLRVIKAKSFDPRNSEIVNFLSLMTKLVFAAAPKAANAFESPIATCRVLTYPCFETSSLKYKQPHFLIKKSLGSQEP